jgi:hypothetical protein
VLTDPGPGTSSQYSSPQLDSLFNAMLLFSLIICASFESHCRCITLGCGRIRVVSTMMDRCAYVL